MVWDELSSLAQEENQKSRDRWIGVYIGILAVLLAVCAMGGGNAAKEATIKNIEASNNWGFFQAKNLRRQMIRLQTEEYEFLLASQPGLPESARATIQARIQQYKDQDKLLTSDPKSGEGLDELFAKGKSLEEQRDVAMRKDPYFDYGQALLQIAIVMASIAIISGGNLLLGVSAVLAAIGTLITINGFTLFWSIPLIG
jgi:shikimate kinase